MGYTQYMIRTAAEYYALASTIDDRRIEAAIAQIPQNVNRAGKHYQKMLKQIHETHQPQRRNRTPQAPH